MACSLKGTVCEALILVVDPTYKMLAATRVKLSAWLNCQIFLEPKLLCWVQEKIMVDSLFQTSLV